MIREPMGGWFVWQKNGRRPNYKHGDYLEAAAEAQRLARENPGRKYIVLQMVAKYSVEAPASVEVPNVEAISA